MTTTHTTPTTPTSLPASGEPRGRGRGRPVDPALRGRFLTAGVDVINTSGLQALTVDSITAQIRAGKAGFYRRWTATPDYLADLICELHAGTVTGLDADALAAIVGEHVRTLAATRIFTRTTGETPR